MKIVVYSKSNCGYCVKAKTWLKTHDVEYTEISIDDPEIRQEFLDTYVAKDPTIKTMPQIFFDDMRIGGFDELIKSEIVQDYLNNR